MHKQTDRQTDRQTNRETERQTDIQRDSGQTGRTRPTLKMTYPDGKTDTQTDS